MKHIQRTIKYSKITVVILITILSLTLSSHTLAVSKRLGDSGLAAYIPDCTDHSNCSDVSIFVETAIGFGRYIFGIIGALALVMFVYGGFVWITSRGSSDKVKKGMEIFGAALIGLIISFSAYILVDYFSKNIIPIDSTYQLSPSTTGAITK